MKYLSLCSFFIPLLAFSQLDKSQKDTNTLKQSFVNYLSASKTSYFTKVERPKKFEVDFFKSSSLMIPTRVIRYYKINQSDTINFQNEALYEKRGYQILGTDKETLYNSYEVLFYGTESQFSLDYYYSLGKGFSCKGSLFLEEGILIQTEYGYGISSGELIVRQDGKIILKKKISTPWNN